MAFSGKPEHLNYKSAHARYAAYAAERCGLRFRSLDGADAYLFEITDGKLRAVFAGGAATPYALNEARAASIARDKAFCATVLREAGVPVLQGEKFFVTERWADMRNPGREPADALRYVSRAALPVFCKPLSASNGMFAEVIESPGAFADYVARVSREHFAILVQPYVQAPEHRVFVLDGEALFSYRKTPPMITGDGVRSVADLITALPNDDASPPPSRLARNAAGLRVSADATPAAGEQLTLDGPANRSVGGGARDLRDGADGHLADLARDASAALGLRLAAVDIFDHRVDGAGPCVIEVNSNPMIATLEDFGRWDLIERIWRANFAAALR